MEIYIIIYIPYGKKYREIYKNSKSFKKKNFFT